MGTRWSSGVNVLADFAVKYRVEASEFSVEVDKLCHAIQSEE
jgi:hypothetical protein